MTETYKDRQKGLNLMVDYGLVHFALSQSWELSDVARQTIYDYYRNIDELPQAVREAIEEAQGNEDFTYNDDYACFDVNGKFDYDLNMPEVVKILTDRPDIKEEAIKHYQLHQAGEFLHVRIRSARNTFRNYKEAAGIRETFEKKYGPDAMASAKPDLIFEFRDNPKQDIDLLRAYLGIVSMIGYRNFISTNKPAALSRMIGAKSKKAFQEVSKLKEVKETVNKYGKRWNMDKLLLSLAERKFIMFLSKKATSVMYVSRYMEPEELAEVVRQSRSKYDLKKKIKDATASL